MRIAWSVLVLLVVGAAVATAPAPAAAPPVLSTTLEKEARQIEGC